MIFRFKTIFFILSIIIFFLTSCEIINPPEELPSYIQIDTFKLQTNEPQEGINTHSITDVWVYIDGSFVGAYELPAHFPVLETGRHKITLYPGIKNNGIAASRVIYPFYTMFEDDTTLTEKQVITINPTVSYRDETVFAWIEDFEEAGITIDTTYRSETDIIIFDETDNQAAHIFLDSTQKFFECISDESFTLPRNSSVYFEMDYKNSRIFAFGLFINKSYTLTQQPVIYLNPSNTWKKICVDLTYYTSTNPDAINFNIFFSIYKTDTLSVADVYLDNLKLIHF